MEDPGRHAIIRVPRKNIRAVDEHAEKIRELFSVRLTREVAAPWERRRDDRGYVYFSLRPEPGSEDFALEDVAGRVQMLVASVCAASGDGDDSSYDSDYEDKPQPQSQSRSAPHSDVSRTTSDTLAAEFAEYVTKPTTAPPLIAPPNVCDSHGYTARVEFGLKLGYSERLVQAALHKLGPSPGQNELLEELIRLGARAAAAGDPAPATASAASSSAPAPAPAPEAGDADAEDAEDGATTGPVCPVGDHAAISTLRNIVIDGSNVAMSHGNKTVFSCRGIQICVDWFRSRGHKEVTVFVPKWRKEAARPDNPISDQEILTELEKDRCLVFTPSRLVGGKRMVCYDDRYVLKLAAETDGVVVSNDNYRDLAQESAIFRRVVEERILMYTFVNDRFMPPDDPLGRSGPTLDHFLRRPAVGPGRVRVAGGEPQRCPYGKKCTYGNKCKFLHPERGSLPVKTVTERLAETAKRSLEARNRDPAAAAAAAAAVTSGNPQATKSVSLPLPGCADQEKAPRKTPLSRTKSNAPSSSSNAPEACYGQAQGGGVPKSRSVENIQGGGGPPASSSHPSPSPSPASSSSYPAVPYGVWGPRDASWGARPSGRPLVFDQGGHVAVAQRLSDPESNPEPANLHRKLHRQLTLNPAFDPRLQHLHRVASRAPPGPPRDYPGWETVMSPAQAPPLPPHQHVTRNASAPDSFRPGPWPPVPAPTAPPPAPPSRMLRHGSTSDPQINLCVEPGSATSDPFDPVWQPLVWAPPQPSTDETRRVLEYHLSAIFPPEQVRQAMRLFPEETSAQKICAAILTMFPVKQ